MHLARLIGIVPLGIGLSVIAFAWSNQFGGAFGVPVFFRLFFTFVALAFVFTGGGILFGLRSATRSGLVDRVLDLQQQMEAGMKARGMTPPGGPGTFTAPRMTSEGYLCPSCNAPIGRQAEVSPHGDVKCAHCGRWFNVHG